MQKGTVVKFIEALESSTTELDFSQMRFVVGDKVFEDPWGKLISSFGLGKWEVAWDGVSYLYEGQQFYPNEDFRKKCKIKNDLRWLTERFERLGTTPKIVRYLKLFGPHL